VRNVFSSFHFGVGSLFFKIVASFSSVVEGVFPVFSTEREIVNNSIFPLNDNLLLTVLFVKFKRNLLGLSEIYYPFMYGTVCNYVNCLTVLINYTGAREGRVRGSADPLKFGAEVRNFICRSVAGSSH